jgi:hypothetical protein
MLNVDLAVVDMELTSLSILSRRGAARKYSVNRTLRSA